MDEYEERLKKQIEETEQIKNEYLKLIEETKELKKNITLGCIDVVKKSIFDKFKYIKKLKKFLK